MIRLVPGASWCDAGCAHGDLDGELIKDGKKLVELRDTPCSVILRDAHSIPRWQNFVIAYSGISAVLWDLALEPCTRVPLQCRANAGAVFCACPVRIGVDHMPWDACPSLPWSADALRAGVKWSALTTECRGSALFIVDVCYLSAGAVRADARRGDELERRQGRVT